jgi:tRNA-2-methylthio-N6-dimethylallyladenosine synthase
MGGRVDPAVAAERLRRLQALQDRHSRERLEAFVGKTAEVLLEGASTRDPDRLCGRTPCFKMVNFTPGGGSGPLRTVSVAAAGAHTLAGEER